MTEKSTDQLQQELMSSNNLDRFLSENNENFRDTPLQLTLQRLYTTTGLSKAALAKQSGISEVYLHQLFSGCRFPSACCAYASAWAHRWRTPRACCGRRGTRRCTPVTGGTPSFSMV